MKSFLEEVSCEILSKFKDLRNVEIIVPNRRTGLFLKKAIISNIAKTSWMPKITPIQEIFVSNSQLIQTEEILLIYYLYFIFRKHTNTNETFDDFYYWGEIILNDFDDIDKYLVDAEKLFSTIKDIKEIDKNFDEYDESELEIIKRFWTNINQASISEHKEKFLSLWKRMFNIYSDFQNLLIEKGIAYQGLIYKNTIKNLDNCKLEKPAYVIVGFNALNKCEKTLFKWLKQHKETYFFWDADLYYLKDEYQEAGRFLRENIRNFPPLNDIGIVDKINTAIRDIEIITAPSPISQVKIISEILDIWKQQPDFELEKTAIILADENLLLPLMYSIPPYIEPYNVSMGFPVKNSATAAFITHLTSLQYNSRNNSSEKTTRFYFKDIFAIINHSFIKSLFPDDTQKIEEYIVNNKLIYVDYTDLQTNYFFKQIFNSKNQDIIQTSEYMLGICSELIALLSTNEEFIVELEFLNKITGRISVLNDCIVGENINIDKNEIYYKLLNNSIRSLSVAFEGEPLAGLQVLGFLETRCLDFDRIIMLSINEGIFPKTSSAQSFIPYNLRRFYELPSIEFQDSIFAYYFYRSLQRCKDVKVIYSAQASDSPSEASRFISQIKHELSKDNNNIKFRNDGYKININPKTINFATKTDDVIEEIKKHLENGISPKAINSFLDCSFKYYLSYIKKIKEPNKLEEEEDAAFFGKLFHQIAQNLYSPYINTCLSEKDFNEISKPENIKNATLEAVKDLFNLKSAIEIERYANKLIVEIVLKYVHNLINFDKNNLPLTILGLEEQHEIYILLKEHNQTIKITGYIDRIDIQNGHCRVLDYKTGTPKIEAKNTEELFEENRDPKCDSISQVLIYAMMINDKHKNNVCPGIFNINKINNNYDYRIKINKTKIDLFNEELNNEFRAKLEQVFADMLNPNLNLKQTENLNSCRYCPYNIICDREN